MNYYGIRILVFVFIRIFANHNRTFLGSAARLIHRAVPPVAVVVLAYTISVAMMVAAVAYNTSSDAMIVKLP